ncbi:MAG: ATP-binding protein [Anaerolineales bacterium]|nr:ATP-binding protein [Anaerolineales bacterium]
MRTVIFPAHFDQLDAIRRFVTQAARDVGLAEKDVCAVEMAVDEACSNIIEHAYRSSKGVIECTCECADDALTVVLRDYAAPFDPANVPPPDLSDDLEERKIGGLGVYLMRQLMDEIHYETDATTGNVLTMVKRRGGEE